MSQYDASAEIHNGRRVPVVCLDDLVPLWHKETVGIYLPAQSHGTRQCVVLIYIRYIVNNIYLGTVESATRIDATISTESDAYRTEKSTPLQPAPHTPLLQLELPQLSKPVHKFSEPILICPQPH